jgi:DNA-binding Xre family transcriptional regulator
MTKLAYILIEKNMTQRDLQRAIIDEYGIKIGDDRISKMVSGKLTNYHINTARIVANTLGVSIDDIVEDD